MWRKIGHACAGVLGVVLGSSYYAFLRIANLKRPWQLRFDPRQPTAPYLVLFGTRGLPKHTRAITFGKHVFIKMTAAEIALYGALLAVVLRHEFTHVLQYRRLGRVRFLYQYGEEIGQFGYQGSPKEQEARAAQYG